MRKLLCIIPVALAILALASSGAVASGAAKTGSTCAYKTSRLVLHGNVSCSEARRTMSSWERAQSSNRCREANCGVGGGWECYSEIRTLGDEVGCMRRRASFKVVAVSRRANAASRLHPGEFSSATPAAAERSCRIERALFHLPYRVSVNRGSTSCREARRRQQILHRR